MRNWISGFVAVAVAVLLVSAPAQARKENDTLDVAFPRNVTTVDGLYSTRRENDILGLLTDDALFYVDPDKLEPVPLAAKSHEFTDDKTLEIELRQDIFFHDGSPMKAEDVVYSINWTMSDKGQTRYKKRIARWVAKVDAIGKYKVRINMKKPYPMALYDLSYYSKIRKKGTYDGDRDPSGLILNGTGPYQVVEYVPAKKLLLKRFDKYRKGGSKGDPSIENISIRTIPDWGTQAAEILSGGIQWTFQMPTEIAEDLGKSPRARLVSGPSMRIGFLIMDAKGIAAKDGPLTKLKVRQAINHAINREAIVKYLVKGTAQVIHAACHPIQFGCTSDVQKYEYSLEKARKLLAEAGYPDGFEMEFWASRERPVMEAIADQLGKVGIKTSLRYVKGSALGKARRAGELSFFFSTWGSYSIPDAGAIGPDHWAQGSNRNLSGDAEVARHMLGAVSTYDEKERLAEFDNAFKKISEQAYWAPLYKFTMNYVTTPDVNFVPSKDGMQRLFQVSWK